MKKENLTFEEKLRAAHAHFVLGVSQHDVASIMAVNQGRVNEACKAVETVLGGKKK